MLWDAFNRTEIPILRTTVTKDKLFFNNYMQH